MGQLLSFGEPPAEGLYKAGWSGHLVSLDDATIPNMTLIGPMQKAEKAPPKRFKKPHQNKESPFECISPLNLETRIQETRVTE